MITLPSGETTVGGVLLAWASWLTFGVIASKADRNTIKDMKARVVRIENILLKQFGPHDE